VSLVLATWARDYIDGLTLFRSPVHQRLLLPSTGSIRGLAASLPHGHGRLTKQRPLSSKRSPSRISGERDFGRFVPALSDRCRRCCHGHSGIPGMYEPMIDRPSQREVSHNLE